MSCKACEENPIRGAFYRWKNANIEIIGCREHVKEVMEVLQPKTTSTDIEEVYAKIFNLFDTGVNLDGMDYEYEKEVLEPTVKELIAPHLSNKSELKKEEYK